MAVLDIEGIPVPIGSHQGKNIIIGSDHGGFELKSKLIPFLNKLGYEIEDVGTASPERCDFPEYASKVAKIVNNDATFQTVGIIACRSGNGVAIVANKFKRIVAARCLNIEDAESARIHLNSNILTIGADKTSETEIKRLVQVWLETPFYSIPEKHNNYLRRYVQVMRCGND